MPRLGKGARFGMKTHKKVVALFAAFVMIAGLGACAKEGAAQPELNPAEQLNKPFESTVSIKYKDIDATARLARRAPGYCRISFSSPESLQDMAVEFTTDTVNVDYKKLHASFRPGSVPGSAISSLLVDTVNTATKENGVTVDYQNEVFTLEGRSESGTFLLTMDGNNGNLLTLSVPADDFEATFTDFSFLAE